MFAVQPQQKQTAGSKDTNSTETCTPNILPCRIHYDGPVKSLNRYWTPAADENDKILQTAYFRGRRLRGRRVAIPDGYEGVVVSQTDSVIPTTRNGAGTTDNNDAEPEEPVKILEKQATFDDYVVWEHEIIPAADDPFVKGVEEWVKFAEAMHSQNDYEKKDST